MTFWRWLTWWRPPCILRACLINFTDDPSVAVKGVLWQSRGAWLTFRDCSLLKVGTTPARMDGEVVVHRDRIAFLQVVG